ncbi:MAG: type IV pilus assembly protein PilM [Bacillota bacterium]
MPSGLFSWRAKSFVGLDIGTSRIKMVELAARPDGVELVRAAMESIPAGAIVEGKILDPVSMADAIRRAMAAGKFRSREVVAAVAGQGVVVRHARFPRMPEEELKDAMKWEAQKYIPYPVEEAMLDFTVLPASSSDQQGMEVMLVAAPAELVNSHLEAMELAGLTVVAVDVQPFTMLRALRQLSPSGTAGAEDGSVAYVDVGAGTTDIVIANGEVVRFTRIVPIGGATFTKAIADRLGVGFDVAERLKIERGQVHRRGEDVHGSEERALAEAIGEVAEAAVLDIRRSIDYHDLQLSGGAEGVEVKRVILSGGGAVLRGFAEYIGEELGLPTEMFEPLSNITVNPRVASKLEDVGAVGPMLVVGIGLALREVVD